MENRYLAPRTGHVSNFFSPIGHVIELVNADCFQEDSGIPQIKVTAGAQTGHISNPAFWIQARRPPEATEVVRLGSLAGSGDGGCVRMIVWLRNGMRKDKNSRSTTREKRSRNFRPNCPVGLRTAASPLPTAEGSIGGPNDYKDFNCLFQIDRKS